MRSELDNLGGCNGKRRVGEGSVSHASSIVGTQWVYSANLDGMLDLWIKDTFRYRLRLQLRDVFSQVCEGESQNTLSSVASEFH